VIDSPTAEGDMKTVVLLYALIAFTCANSFGQGSADSKTETKVSHPPPCTTQQTPAFMTSWAGQPGVKDHSESQAVTKGTHFACLAFAGPTSPVPPACYLSFQNDGPYTLPPHNDLRAPQDDVVTLSCNGESPSCCKVQVTPDPKALTKEDERELDKSKIQVKVDSTTGEVALVAAAAAAAQTITSTTDPNRNQHPGSVAVLDPSSVTCASAVGNNPRNYPPSCNIVAPGYWGIVNIGQIIGTSGAGTVNLTCNGEAPLRCSAQIH
jgi:hypothetical protein